MNVEEKNKGGRPSLETLQGCRHAMAQVLLKMRAGRMQATLGSQLVNGYTQLAHLLQDERDSKYKKRLRVLWEAHQKGQGLPVEDEAGALEQ